MGRSRGSRSRSTSIPPGIVSPWLAEESEPKIYTDGGGCCYPETRLLALPALDREGHIVPAEPERIRESHTPPALDLPVRGGIQVTLRVRSELIDRGRDDTAGGGQQGYNDF